MSFCHCLIQPRKESRKRRPGFDQEIYSETTYYIKNGKLCLHGALQFIHWFLLFICRSVVD